MIKVSLAVVAALMIVGCGSDDTTSRVAIGTPNAGKVTEQNASVGIVNPSPTNTFSSTSTGEAKGVLEETKAVGVVNPNPTNTFSGFSGTSVPKPEEKTPMNAIPEVKQEVPTPFPNMKPVPTPYAKPDIEQKIPETIRNQKIDKIEKELEELR